MKIQVTIEATTIEEYVEAINALAAGYQVAPKPVTVNVTASAKAVANGDFKVKTASDEMKVAEESKPVENEVKYISTKSAKRLDDKIKGLDDETLESLFAEFNIASVVGLPESDLRKFDAALNKALKDAEAPKEEKNTSAPETEKQTENEPSEASEQSETSYDFVSVKLKAKQIANLPDGKADVKFILDKLGVKKLSDLSEDQYATFMELAAEVEDKPSSKEDKGAGTEPVQESNAKVSQEDATDSDNGEAKPVTLEMIRGKAKQLSVEGYKDEIRGVLKEFGAVSLTKIPKDQYSDFYAALVKING
ncbi:hypothetical protein [Bacillus phage Carmen17]|uniref:Uncharacterized protein n=1 Tax=Bacillus phage Carmen17 TaxID=2072797 RepID=A0A2I7QIP2_9CAUD|nr:hypothetical protein HWB53_gp29 [Bacillus phage Carmen17]AUR81253.1 hypothetical protein [Bacillus phage Carmen17]